VFVDSLRGWRQGCSKVGLCLSRLAGWCMVQACKVVHCHADGSGPRNDDLVSINDCDWHQRPELTNQYAFTTACSVAQCWHLLAGMLFVRCCPHTRCCVVSSKNQCSHGYLASAKCVQCREVCREIQAGRWNPTTVTRYRPRLRSLRRIIHVISVSQFLRLLSFTTSRLPSHMEGPACPSPVCCDI
jgi:hypothetical protein